MTYHQNPGPVDKYNIQTYTLYIEELKFKQMKNWNLDRDYNLGPPDLQPGALPISE
jgi:hypothetical protein